MLKEVSGNITSGFIHSENQALLNLSDFCAAQLPGKRFKSNSNRVILCPPFPSKRLLASNLCKEGREEYFIYCHSIGLKFEL